MLDLRSLENAVAQLEEALKFHDSELAVQRPRLQLQLRAAAIQAFEFTYELGFAMLKRHLEHVMANPAAVDEMSFKAVIREALGRGLVAADVDAWERFRKFRGTTSHTYDAGKAQAIFEAIPEFLDEVRYLLKRLRT
jgi:nucleotidyltransferase substrate binding protein (TIGR01987 family)